jgi:amino acid transporter
LWPLVVATFFMVSGGTYGTEDIVHGAGYFGGILILIVTPLIWSLPTALMIGELSSAIPAEGGFYVWVRSAMGDFWGFREAWLSLVASIFDMAIYPALFIAYLGRLSPTLVAGHRDLAIGVTVVAACAALNLAGIRVVAITSVWLFFLLSSPFIAITLFAAAHPGSLAHVATAPTTSHIGIVAGLLVAMWNYMGWDNASTIAGEVAQPQRTYPRAMLTAVALVALSYIIPIGAMSLTKLSPSAWETGSWAEIANMLGGPVLRAALVAGGMMSAFGMFNALVLSYSRLPYAMALDGMLPSIFAKTTLGTNVPWLSVVVLSVAWAACLGLGFERLVTIDILIYGGSLLLEFVALVVLRFAAPDMPRPFRVPGGKMGAFLVGIFPALLLGFAIFESESERILGMNALLFGLILIVAGFVVYAVNARITRKSSASST